jgi:lysophospholipase L1-like esterase
MYAARTAQLLGADLINLGFGGGAYLEPQMADYIASRTDWDFVTLETGINIPGMGPEKFGKLAEQFISTIAGAHRDKWIFCTGVYTCGADYLGEKWAAEYRKVIQDIVSRLDLPRLIYVDGRALLPSLTGLTSDLLHPSPAGMEEMARNLSAVISKAISPA